MTTFEKDWFEQYQKIAEDYFWSLPEKFFDIGDWSCHEQQYKDGYTPSDAFFEDLYTDL